MPRPKTNQILNGKEGSSAGDDRSKISAKPRGAGEKFFKEMSSSVTSK